MLDRVTIYSSSQAFIYCSFAEFVTEGLTPDIDLSFMDLESDGI